MADELALNFPELLEKFTPKIMNRLTDVGASPVLGAGIVKVTPITKERFAFLEEEEPYGDLYVVEDDESLGTSKLPGGTIKTYKEKEFGRSIVLNQSDIDKYVGKVWAVGGVIDSGKIGKTDAERFQQAKDDLTAKSLGQLEQMAVTRVAKSLYGALSGTVSATRKTGGDASLTFDITQGGSVTTAWSDPTANILSDMQAIETALLALAKPSDLQAGHTIINRKIMQYILQNNYVKALFPQYSGIFGVSEKILLEQGILDQYFGKLVKDDSTYRNESKATTRHLDQNYIICTTDTQNANSPAVEVFIAPTGLDDSYETNGDKTGFSLHTYDGLTDKNKPSYKTGELTFGIRGKIAILVRDAKRIYRKKVLNI